MHSTMDLVMTKPSPVPFSFAARCSAGWQNGTNSACCFAAGMPTPLSRTSKVIRARRGWAKSKKSALSSSSSFARGGAFAGGAFRGSSLTVTTSSTSASRPTTPVLYFTALSTKLTQHCRRRKKSPTNAVLKCSGVASVTTTSGRLSGLSSRDLKTFVSFAFATTSSFTRTFSSLDALDGVRAADGTGSASNALVAFWVMSVTCSMSCRTVQTSSESSIAEAPFAPFASFAPSNLAKSRIWLISPSSASAEVSEALMNALVKSVSSPDSIASVLKPMMEFNGVRSSCVTLKKKARCACDICVAIFCLCSSTRSRHRSEPAEITSEYENFVRMSLYR